MAAEGPWVLDTSVVAPWFSTDEPQRPQALALRDAVRDQPRRFVIPHLLHSELVHVLNRKSGGDAVFVRDALALFLRLGMATLPLTEGALLRTAHWAAKGIGGYDATFVALAEDLGGRWVTADERAAKVAGRTRAVTLRSWAASARRSHRPPTR